MKKETYNVVQWSSGNVGKASIIGINNRKDLHLSGLIVSGKNKIGMDAGTIIGIEELGVIATDNVDDFLSADLDIDCINYTPLASFRVNEDPDLDKNNIIKILKNWNSASNSSPIEGLEIALKRYTSRKLNTSIYIFGDEFTGGSYTPVFSTIEKLSIKRNIRINGIGFISLGITNDRFATLMREIAENNNGAFLALPIVAYLVFSAFLYSNVFRSNSNIDFFPLSSTVFL